jgi:hypothetical protein
MRTSTAASAMESIVRVRDGHCVRLLIIRHLKLRRRHVPDRFEQPRVLNPERGEFQGLQTPPRALLNIANGPRDVR